MKLYLSVKPDNKARQIAQNARELLEQEGHTISLSPETVDLIVSVGGDGSLLHNIHRYYRLGIPFVGINGGKLGFNCAAGANLEGLAQAILREPVWLPVFEVTLADGKEVAVQDLRVERLTHQPVRLKIAVNGKSIAKEHVGDGVIITGALGSTGYHLSAGGKPISLSENTAYITPVCPVPHSAFDSILVPRLIEGEVMISSKYPTRLVLDNRAFELPAQLPVFVRKIDSVFGLIGR